MRIVRDFPPMYDEIRAAFPQIRGRKPFFAWGNIIYTPFGGDLTRSLIEHEGEHGARQAQDITGWWRRYIDDPEFRLHEELLAHRVEYRSLMGSTTNRRQRRMALKLVAGRLSGPFYGRMMTLARAKEAILNERT